jgi:hypothetical protein
MTGPFDAMSAGLYLVTALLAGGAIGFGIGSLVGAPMPLAIVGGFAGLILGFRLVYTRFKEL